MDAGGSGEKSGCSAGPDVLQKNVPRIKPVLEQQGNGQPAGQSHFSGENRIPGETVCRCTVFPGIQTLKMQFRVKHDLPFQAMYQSETCSIP